ncbi:TolB family protein [Frateuria sp. GZRR33]|uniref:TolB family protein n=1 Tax=Frateuria sp. GZRR33 TaxID=3351535 RepID=UPI003EDC2127
MKTNKLASSICAVLLTALGASSAFAQTSTASILFTRQVFRFDGALGSQLYRVKPSGQNVVTLAPVTYGFDIHGASWSPGGASVVYELIHQAIGSPTYTSQLYVVNRQGGSLHQITTGDALHSQPSWGPNGVIAFALGSCLATVRPDGTQQHVVFCPPHESGQHGSILLSLFHWTPSGNGILIEAAGDEGGLEPVM